MAVDSYPTIKIEQVRFSYGSGFALGIDDLEIASGESSFILGPSGSGKTTFLNLVSGLLTAESGSVSLLGRNLSAMSQKQRDIFRGDNVGYIFQMFNLIPYLSMLENVLLPCRFSNAKKQRCLKIHDRLQDAAAGLLRSLNLPDALHHRRVTDLSVGQSQRVAAARALIGNPPVIIADEPSSALDPENSRQFRMLLRDHCKNSGTTLLYVSHNHGDADEFDRSIDILSFASKGKKEQLVCS